MLSEPVVVDYPSSCNKVCVRACVCTGAMLDLKCKTHRFRGVLRGRLADIVCDDVTCIVYSSASCLLHIQITERHVCDGFSPLLSAVAYSVRLFLQANDYMGLLSPDEYSVHIRSLTDLTENRTRSSWATYAIQFIKYTFVHHSHCLLHRASATTFMRYRH